MIILYRELFQIASFYQWVLLKWHIYILDNPSAKYEYYPAFVRAIRIAAANGKGSVITGLTILAEELFIVSQLSSVVEVYHSKEFTFRRRWKIGVADPGGIESCKINQCLYIVGWKISGRIRTILRVDQQGKLITEWHVTDNWSNLSVTDDSNVILTVQEENKLIEYSLDGQWIREINLSSDASMFISNLWRSVKLASGNFVVCCGLEADELHGLFIVDALGTLQKVFGRNKGFEVERMHQPVYLVVDKEGFVLVADRKNSRVLLFDSNLEFQKEILFQENSDLRFPSSLYLDESRSLLYVVDNDRDENDSRVLIFRLS